MLTAIPICPVCVPDVLAPCCVNLAAVNTRETGNLLDTTMNEEWRMIDGFEGRYEVSNLGRVRIAKQTKQAHNPIGYILKSYPNPSGYPTHRLSSNNKARTVLLHRLVLFAFVGPCPKGMETRHLNGDRKDSRLPNLAWGTSKQNAYDRELHGTTTRGVKNGRAKLDESEVIEIRNLISQGLTNSQIASLYSIHHDHVYSIKNRRRWRHLP